MKLACMLTMTFLHQGYDSGVFSKPCLYMENRFHFEPDFGFGGDFKFGENSGLGENFGLRRNFVLMGNFESRAYQLDIDLKRVNWHENQFYGLDDPMGNPLLERILGF